MTIGIYNPYHNTLGGGEQYMFTFASYFLQKGHTVIYFSGNVEEVTKAEKRFGFDFTKLQIQPNIFQKGSLLEKLKTTQALDILFFYSDGSFSYSLAKKTYLIFQFPVPWVNAKSPALLIKKTTITDIIVNSQFTKQFIDKTFSTNAKILYPSIQMEEYLSKPKEKFIISVGRFTKGMNTKRQDILIKAFRSLVDDGLTDWKLIIAGGVLDEDSDEFEKHRENIKGYPIELEKNISRERLLDLYARASIYWHAAGFGIDDAINPEKVEHFGITTVEAMASGAIPCIYPAGGQKEIVENDVTGVYWNSVEELKQKTIQLIGNKPLQEKLSFAALHRSKDFDKKVFYEKLDKILSPDT